MKRKSVVIQGIKDRSEIREHIVTRKQGCEDEDETREGRLGEGPEMGVCGRKGRSGEDPGKIHRSARFGVRECQRRRERREEDEEEETRIRSQGTRMWWGFHGC